MMKTNSPIKVLAICASPRKGNSYFLLEKALEAVEQLNLVPTEVNRFHFGQKLFAPCDACMKHKVMQGQCRIKDSFQPLRDLWVGADAVLYAFPVYHMGIPGQLKCFIDRLGNSLGYYFQSGEPRTFHIPRLNKAMGFITQGAHLYGGQDLALNYMINHALLMRCIPVPGDLPASYIGAGGWTGGQAGKSSLEKLFEEKDRDASNAVEAAQQVARRTVEMALIVKEGLRAARHVFDEDLNYRYVLKNLD
ncbi:MAG: flavodoxin family protein [Deltaproteobacteria bacterium]|nr:flavodoxin family protein [Deltaproteobacteria bacterium]